MADQNSPRGFGAAARVTALAASVMDLHVRIALQEVDRETIARASGTDAGSYSRLRTAGQSSRGTISIRCRHQST